MLEEVKLKLMSYNISLFIVFLSFSIQIMASDICLKADSNVLDITKLKNKILEDATNDLPTFCQWNRMDRFAKGFEQETQQKYSELRNSGDIEKAADLLAFNVNDRKKNKDIWSLSMAGHPKIKNLVNTMHTSFLVDCKREIGANFDICDDPPPTELKKYFAKPFVKSLLLIPEYKDDINHKDVSFMKKISACTVFLKFTIPECLKSFNKIEELMKVQGFVSDQNSPAPFAYKESKTKSSDAADSMVTGVPIVKKVLTDPTITEGLRLVAMKLLDRQSSKIEKNDNIFDDIKGSFLKAGMAPGQVEDKVWDVLAVLATTGPNFAKRWSREGTWHRMDMKYINDNPNAYALQVIAEAIPKLDTLKGIQQKGEVYSLPTSVKFPCDIGKSYHFWMTAYLSRELVKSGVKKNTAEKTSYLADVAYQMSRDNFSGPELNIARMDRLSATENGMRLDLTLAAGGAKFGSSTLTNPSNNINLEEVFKKTILDAPINTTPVSALINMLPKDGGKQLNFLERVQPMSILNSVP